MGRTTRNHAVRFVRNMTSISDERLVCCHANLLCGRRVGEAADPRQFPTYMNLHFREKRAYYTTFA